VRRRLFNLATAVSLLSFIGVALVEGSGQTSPNWYVDFPRHSSTPQGYDGVFGFRIVRGASSRGEEWALVIPGWFMLLTTGALPVLWIDRYLRARGREERVSRRLCPACSYDLRATAQAPQEGGALLDRCPECGAEARPRHPESAAA
jgi:hypothetical protein